MKSKQIKDCNYKKKTKLFHFVSLGLCGNRGIVIFIFVFCLFIFNQNILSADEREVFTVEASIPRIQELTIENIKPFPTIGADDYNRGYVDLKDAVTLSVSSNIPWKIVIYTNKINLYRSRGKFKSVDNFKCRVGSEPYQTFSQNEGIIVEGKGGIKDQTIKLDYRMNISWIDTPPGKWELKPEFRIEPDHSERMEIKYQQYSESRLFSTSNSVTFPIVTAEDLDKGYIDSKYCVRLSDLFNQIKSANISVSNVFITCEQPYFTPYEMKKSHRDLLWKLHNEPESRFRPIDFQMDRIHSGGSFQNVELDFRLLLDWEDMPGNYSFKSNFILETKNIKQSIKAKKNNQSAFE